MFERRQKLTVGQIRTLFPFDETTMALKAGVRLETLFDAMGGYPIERRDGERIIVALSEHAGRQLTFEQMEIVLRDEWLVLWVVRASSQEQPRPGGEVRDAYHLIFARDLDHARQVADPWLRQQPQLPYHYFSPWPQGLRIAEVVVPGRRKLDGQPLLPDEIN